VIRCVDDVRSAMRIIMSQHVDETDIYRYTPSVNTAADVFLGEHRRFDCQTLC